MVVLKVLYHQICSPNINPDFKLREQSSPMTARSNLVGDAFATVSDQMLDQSRQERQGHLLKGETRAIPKAFACLIYWSATNMSMWGSKEVMAWITRSLGTPRGRYDAAKQQFPLITKPRLSDPVGLGECTRWILNKKQDDHGIEVRDDPQVQGIYRSPFDKQECQTQRGAEGIGVQICARFH